MSICIMRHGETTSDVENRYGGDLDDHLTAKGITQAREAAVKLTHYGMQAIFASSRIRAKETAEILKGALQCDLHIVDDI